MFPNEPNLCFTKWTCSFWNILYAICSCIIKFLYYSSECRKFLSDFFPCGSKAFQFKKHCSCMYSRTTITLCWKLSRKSSYVDLQKVAGFPYQLLCPSKVPMITTPNLTNKLSPLKKWSLPRAHMPKHRRLYILIHHYLLVNSKFSFHNVPHLPGDLTHVFYLSVGSGPRFCWCNHHVFDQKCSSF